MNEARLNMLSFRYAPQRKVVDRSCDAKGNYFMLECGHTITTAPHRSMMGGDNRRCHECGKVVAQSML